MAQVDAKWMAIVFGLGFGSSFLAQWAYKKFVKPEPQGPIPAIAVKVQGRGTSPTISGLGKGATFREEGDIRQQLKQRVGLGQIIEPSSKVSSGIYAKGLGARVLTWDRYPGMVAKINGLGQTTGYKGTQERHGEVAFL